MTDEQLQELLQRYREGRCTPIEKAAIEKWYGDRLQQSDWDFAAGEEQVLGARLQQQMSSRLGFQKPARRVVFMRRMVAAAAILILLTTGTYLLFFRTKDPIPNIVQQTPPANIEAPASSRAMITLAGGQRIYLDSATQGRLASEGTVNIVKLADGAIAYNGASSTVAWNTLVNPRGSRPVSITLSDGTKVWLNTESSLRYPVSFAANERKVEISGEAYFEVAHDKTKPFTVSKGSMAVEVLGTHFNVHAYDDEADIKVTLLEGSVRLTLNAERLTLKPGQQGIASAHSPLTIHHSPDIEQVMSWRNELFLLRDADIQTVMNQVARWYDVDIEYKAPVKEVFVVEMNRRTDLENVLKILEATGGVHFTRQGRKIIVQP